MSPSRPLPANEDDNVRQNESRTDIGICHWHIYCRSRYHLSYRGPTDSGQLALQVEKVLYGEPDAINHRTLSQ